MRNKSIFQGCKELGEFRFMREGICWGVYRLPQSSAVRIGAVACRKESNKALHARALQLCEATNA